MVERLTFAIANAAEPAGLIGSDQERDLRVSSISHINA
jgi:hypothetical protein